MATIWYRSSEDDEFHYYKMKCEEKGANKKYLRPSHEFLEIVYPS